MTAGASTNDDSKLTYADLRPGDVLFLTRSTRSDESLISYLILAVSDEVIHSDKQFGDSHEYLIAITEAKNRGNVKIMTIEWYSGIELPAINDTSDVLRRMWVLRP